MADLVFIIFLMVTSVTKYGRSAWRQVNMKFNFEKSLGSRKINKQGELFPVQALSWAPNNRRFAYCDDDRCIWIYGENLEYQIHFPTKPVEKEFGKNSFLVTCLDFSPDSARLAVGQSDEVVYVYRLPKETDKTELAVVGKYVQTSPVTALIWLFRGSLIFGLLDGGVKTASGSKNSDPIHQTDSQVLSLLSNSSGSLFISAHIDGTIFVFAVEDSSFRTLRKILTATKSPNCITFAGDFIFIAGSDNVISIYDSYGKQLQELQAEGEGGSEDQAITAAVAAPSGRYAVFAAYNRLRVLSFASRKGLWVENEPIFVENLYVVPGMAWKKDGTKLALASLFGAVDILDCAVKKQVQQEKYEVTYVSSDQVLLRDMEKNRRFSLRSESGLSINKLTIMKDLPVVVAATSEQLLLLSTENGSASEVPWNWYSTETKPSFHVEGHGCVIFHENSLSIVELGRNEIIFVGTTPNFYARFFSLHMDSPKTFAFLPTLKSLRVVDLDRSQTIVTFKHEVDLDWLTLNGSCTVVVARDVRYTLLLLNIGTKEKTILCQKATFTELVPMTDILIAQEGRQIRAWYNVGEGKDGFTEKSVPAEGKIIEVTRGLGQTTVQTEDGPRTNTYILEDEIGQFDTLLRKKQLDRAYDYLRATPDTPLRTSQWRTLVTKSLENHNFLLAEKIFMEMKDARAKDVRELISRTEQLQKEHGRSLDEILDHYTVKATIERLKGDTDSAEKILLAQRDTKRAIILHSNSGNYIRALTIAQEHDPSLVPELSKKFQQQLTQEKKNGPLAQLLAHTGQWGEAAALLLMPPFQPLEAYRLIVGHPDKVVKTAEGRMLMQQLLPELQKEELHEMVGRLMEINGEVDGALKAYRAAHKYEHAIEFARKNKPEQVVPLEIECARYFAKIRNWQEAITHFIEANMNTEALDAAIHCLDFKKAAQILSVIDEENVSKNYGQRLAMYFQDRDELEEAVEMYKKIGKPKDGIKMYLSRGKVDEAYKYAETLVKNDELRDIFREEAQNMILAKKYADAEKVFLKISDVDSAVDMYSDLRQFQRVVALVKKHKEHMLNDTFVRIAEIYRKSGEYRQAELYYSKAQRYRELVQMYVEEEKWSDAYRCAQEYIKEMAGDILYLWIGRLDAKEGIAVLRNLGAAREFIRMALRSAEFESAVTVANEIAPEAMPEILVARALHQSTAGRFEGAEQDFLAAGHADQAVQMYIDAEKWSDAIRLTSTHFPEELPNVQLSHAITLVDAGQYLEAERELIALNRPDYVINMYKERSMWEDALRVAREFRPSEVQALEMEYDKNGSVRPRTTRPGEHLMKQARAQEEKSDYSGAVQLYLRYINETSADSAQILRVCGRIGELASSFLGQMEAETALDAVADKLLALNRPALAAAVLTQIGKDERALEILMDHDAWDEAKSLALRLQQPQYTRMLESRYKDFLRAQGKVEQLASVDASSAVEIYARNGEWEKCLKVCLEIRDLKLLAKYLYEYGVILLKKGEESKAVELFTNYGTPVTADTLDVFRHIFFAFLAKRYKDVNEGFRQWCSLRDLIHTAGENMMKTTDVSVGTTAEFEKYLHVCILYANHFAFISEEGTKELGWMALLSQLRYSDIISPDKAFYDAGRAAQQLKWAGTADVLFNFYLDWRECILHQNNGLVDYGQFEGSDIPTNVKIPTESSVSTEAYEEVKAWIMKSALDRSLKFELKKDERGVFDISLSGGQYPPCVLTGFPVLSNGIKLGTTGRYARKSDLNRFLQAVRSSRSDKLEDVRRFLVKWCGAATELNYAFV